MNERFAIDETIRFAEERTEYMVKAIGRRYAVLMKPYNAEDDDEAESREEGEIKDDEYFYTIVDSETMMRGPHNLICCFWDFHKPEDIAECLSQLESGEIELSRRRSIPVLMSR